MKLCAKRFCHHRYILFLDAADFLWLQPPHGDNLTPSARNLFLGSPRPLSSFASALPALWKWITSFPVFKSGGSAETISFCLVRGCSGLIIWAIILGYGALNCLINPVTQFSDPKGLPVSLVTNDGDNTSFRGRVEGFIVGPDILGAKASSYPTIMPLGRRRRTQWSRSRPFGRW